MASVIGRLIAKRYLINALVASGGMASVYLAHDTVLEREVALKIIHPHLVGDKSFLEKFRREARIAAKLSHPNLVNVFDQGSDGEITFLVMEYVPGITLRDALNDHGALEPARALEIIEPLTQGLAAAHAAGILHRDLKPENVFLSDDGRVKLGDFGLARAISQHTQTGSVVGTVAYLSPELVLRGTADARSDIYSLGVMIYELLTGKQPYEGDQAVQVAYQHANDNIPAPSIINPSIPELLDEIVLWTTARNPAHRPSDAKALLPVITRARTDLGRGKTSNLSEITQTLRVQFQEAPAAGQTEVLNAELSQLEPERTSTAIALEKGTRRSALFLWIVTLLALFGAAGAGWWLSAGPGGFASVPSLEGRTLEAATEVFDPLGIEVLTENENSANISAGRITRTDPPAGSRIAKNSSITVYLSVGPKQVQVPKVQGLNLNQVNALLVESDLQPGKESYFFASEPEGQVFSLSKQAGSTVTSGTVIDISVSLGPLPELIGLTESEAREVLADYDVEILENTELFSNEVQRGRVVSLVLSQEPLPRAGKVQLEISKGPEIIEVPNVIGETIAAARNLLQGLGFKVVIDTDELKSNYGIAKVKKQNPIGLTKLKYGDTVVIISR